MLARGRLIKLKQEDEKEGNTHSRVLVGMDSDIGTLEYNDETYIR